MASPNVSQAELATLDGVSSAIQTQLDAKTSTSSIVLNFAAANSATIGSSYANVDSVVNQSVTIPQTRTYVVMLTHFGIYPSSTLSDDVYFQLIVDNSAAGEFGIGQSYQSDATQKRLNGCMMQAVSLTSGSRNIRIQAKATTGGRATVDSLCKFQLAII